MPLVDLSAGEWLAIITHLKQWLGNLRRAGRTRRNASRQSLRAVIKAVRETTCYLRCLREGGRTSIDREKELSLLWTELSFALEDLGLNKLAGRCALIGRFWADPALFEAGFLDRAGQRLQDVEQLALAALANGHEGPGRD